ncbi:MAG: polysaccharide deacetylase family protein [Deltaproteobacteria bacterium]|nr:polysaccharide deacetylase family protein [Deltaproteobacteria bacterium]
MNRFTLYALAWFGGGALVLLLTPQAGWWVLLPLWVAGFAGLALWGVFSIRAGLFVKSMNRLPAGHHLVALTFDDGPDPRATPALLDLLARRRVPATFFCRGDRAQAHPELIRRLDQEGHLVGSHTMHHHWWHNFLAGRALEREIIAGQEAVGRALGRLPRLYRPPMGQTNPHLPRVVRQHGLVVVGWEVRPLDRRAPARQVVRRVLRRVRDGSFILLHDGGVDPAHLVAVVEGVLDGLAARGLGCCRADYWLKEPAFAPLPGEKAADAA